MSKNEGRGTAGAEGAEIDVLELLIVQEQVVHRHLLLRTLQKIFSGSLAL